MEATIAKESFCRKVNQLQLELHQCHRVSKCIQFFRHAYKTEKPYNYLTT